MGIRIIHVNVPKAIESTKTARLICEHDTEDEILYAVKWYRGSREFFRYTPKEIPAVKIFPFPGLHIDVSTIFNYLFFSFCKDREKKNILLILQPFDELCSRSLSGIALDCYFSKQLEIKCTNSSLMLIF